MTAVRKKLLLRIGAAVGVIALLLGAAPAAAADPATDAAAVAPTLSLQALGLDSTVAFYGETSSTTLSIPVPPGMAPASLQFTTSLPFAMQSATLTVAQDDRLITKIGLPLTDLAPLQIPLAGATVVDDAVSVTLTLSALSVDRFCLDQLNPVQLINGSVTYSGTQVVPTTVADFLPPVLNLITIAVPASPSLAESDAAVHVAAALVARFRSQAPNITVVPLPDGASQLPGATPPGQRVVVVKEGPQQGLSLVGEPASPQLLISGSADQLRNQSRLLTDRSLGMAVSTNVVAGELELPQAFPGSTTTLAALGQPALSSVGLSPQVGIALDQTRFGHPIQAVRVHLVGTYTPPLAGLSSQLTASVGGVTIDTWPAEPAGAIDRWVDVPDRLLQRYTSLAVALNTSGNTGRCGEFRPLTLRIDGSSVVESAVAKPPIPSGFRSLPQALMPQMEVGITPDNFADTVRATQIVTGLQRLTGVPLTTTVKPLDQVIGSDAPAVVISPNGWDNKTVALPVSSTDTSVTLAGPEPGAPSTTLTLAPSTPFGSLQSVFDGRRSLLIATSTGAPEQLDALLQWLDQNPQRWSQLNGAALVNVAGREPISVPGRDPISVYGPLPADTEQAALSRSNHTLTWWLVGAAAAAAVGAALIVVGRRTRRRRTTATTSGPEQD